MRGRREPMNTRSELRALAENCFNSKEDDFTFIRAANPETVLNLLDALDVAESALEKVAGREALVGYAFDGRHQTEALFQEMALRRACAMQALAQLEKQEKE